MTTFINEFLSAGLFGGIDGDDSRIAKMEKAAENLAVELKENPAQIIRAILAGVDPDISENDPAIQKAMEHLTNEWKAVSSVYTDTPINLLRSILIEACSQASEGKNGAIIWFTLADTLPFIKLANEKSAIMGFVAELAKNSESIAITQPEIRKAHKKYSLEVGKNVDIKPVKVDRAKLEDKIAASVGPHKEGNTAISGANPTWSNSGGTWSWEFTKRFTPLFADVVDNVANNCMKMITEVGEKNYTGLSEVLNEQRLWIQSIAKSIDDKSEAEQTRLDALWWSEALYSPSVAKSYRELSPQVASVIMAVDLVNLVAKPTPASVGYLLSESVNKLPEAGFNTKHKLIEVLNTLRDLKSTLPEKWGDFLTSPPKEGRLSIRDAFISALTLESWDAKEILRKTGVRDDYELSYPQLAHAIFRQEQAVQLAGK